MCNAFYMLGKYGSGFVHLILSTATWTPYTPVNEDWYLIDVISGIIRAGSICIWLSD